MQPQFSKRENVSLKMVATMAVVLIIVTFSLVVGFPFLNWGDPQLILNNPNTLSSGPHAFKTLFSDTSFGLLTPVTVLSYAFEQGFAGFNANTYHFDNIILNIINTLLLLVLLSRLLPQRPIAVAAAVFFFAVHPLHVETVAWVSERKELLCAFFLLSSILSFLESHRSGPKWFLASLVTFAMSLFCSSLAITLPLLIFLIEPFVYREKNIAVIFKRAAPYWVVAAVFAVFQNEVLKSHSGSSAHLLGNLSATSPFVTALGASAQALVFFISKSVMPSHLSGLYELGLYHLTLRDLVVAVLVCLLTAVALWQLENIRRPVTFGAFFFLIMILPALPLVPLPHRGVFSDSDFYIAGIGLLIIYGSIFSELVRFEKLQVPLMGLGALIIGCYLAVAHNQTNEWSSSEKFWSNIVKQEPGSSRGRLNLGEVLYEKGETIGAGVQYFQAIKLDPKSAQAYGDLGLVYLSRHRFDKAQENFQKAIQIDPSRADIHLALGMAYVKNDERKKGLEEWAVAEKLDPKLHDKIVILSSDKKAPETTDQTVSGTEL